MKLPCVCLPLCLLFSATPWADCRFESGSSQSVRELSIGGPVQVPRDAPAGTALRDLLWQPAPGTSIRCRSQGQVSGRLEGNFGAVVNGVPGHRDGSVFASGIPGIGIQAFWCNQGQCNPDYNAVTPLPRLDWTVGPYRYPLSSRWWVRLVKTGPLASGVHAFQGTATVRYINLDVARLNVSGSVTVSPRGCRVAPASSAQLVRLPPVPAGDFVQIGTLPDPSLVRPFSIQLQCDPGIRLSYRIDPTYPTAHIGVLGNRPGEGMARNVGVQLFRQLGGREQVLELARPVLHSLSTTAGAQDISLAARYYQMTSQVAAGAVNTGATFSMIYE